MDPARGRFRSFLLSSLKNFVANEHSRTQARKRGGGTARIPLELHAAERRYRLELADHLTPELLYHLRWALTLLAQVLHRLRVEFVAAGKQATFDHLKTYLTDALARPSYAQMATRLSISEGAVKIAVHWLRRRYRELLREEIAQTVARPEEVAQTILFLASEGTDFLTGCIVDINGASYLRS